MPSIYRACRTNGFSVHILCVAGSPSTNYGPFPEFCDTLSIYISLEQHTSYAPMKKFHLCKWRFIGDVPFQYRERGLGGPPMLGSPLAPAGGTEPLAHLHRSISVPPAVASGA
jgi:hypothetical protein